MTNLARAIADALHENPYGCTRTEMRRMFGAENQEINAALAELTGIGTDKQGGFYLIAVRARYLERLRESWERDCERRHGRLLAAKTWV